MSQQAIDRLKRAAYRESRYWTLPANEGGSTGVVVDPNDLMLLLKSKGENVLPGTNGVQDLAERILLADMANPASTNTGTSTEISEGAWALAEAFYKARP